MLKKQRVYVYTLSALDYKLWKLDSKTGQATIRRTACKRARMSGRNFLIILGLNGEVLEQLHC